MLEKGWATLTVKVDTASLVKDMARAKGLTVDEFINLLMGGGRSVWVTCKLCGARLKFENLNQHMLKVHQKSVA